MRGGAIDPDPGDTVARDDGDALLGVAAFVPRVGLLERQPRVHLLHHCQQGCCRVWNKWDDCFVRNGLAKVLRTSLGADLI